jgi:hypothetical protein
MSKGTVGEGLSTTENGERAIFEDGMAYGAELAWWRKGKRVTEA